MTFKLDLLTRSNAVSVLNFKTTIVYECFREKFRVLKYRKSKVLWKKKN